ncbi:hypothetical protein QBC34DRAFT_411545 [Podospora aff. communis PSN243]|uniref:Apple domain-containing protein n=1 Tax=Podospora aff. communis PSN243 TaxID=3040156 RepID=A0AAV9GD40_9PEZI|nr:hypothetical protein QBC34DRAFT_411545 [Podospora aff. communis PSN243]
MGWIHKILAGFGLRVLALTSGTLAQATPAAGTAVLACPTPLRTFEPDCTLSDFKTYTSPAGHIYLIGCFTAGAWGGRHDIMAASWHASPEACADHCAGFAQCKGFTFSGSSGPWANCYIYDALPNPQVTKQSGYGGVALDAFLLAHAWGGSLPEVEARDSSWR